MNILCGLVILFFSSICLGQLGLSEFEIRENNTDGYGFKIVYTPLGNDSIRTLMFARKRAKGRVNTAISCYFTEKDGSCGYVITTESIAEINTWVTFFNKKGYVSKGELIWVDYETGIKYEILRYPEDGFFEIVKTFN